MHRLPPMTRPDLGRRALAEGLAAFALVFAGCGAIVADATRDGALGTLGVGLVFGLVIMVMVYATGHLSGAHINPAVTLAFALTRHFPGREAAAYVAAQAVGATAAALLLGAAWDGSPADLGASLVVVQAAAEDAALAAAGEGAATALLALGRRLRRLGVAIANHFPGLG